MRRTSASDLGRAALLVVSDASAENDNRRRAPRDQASSPHFDWWWNVVVNKQFSAKEEEIPGADKRQDWQRCAGWAPCSTRCRVCSWRRWRRNSPENENVRWALLEAAHPPTGSLSTPSGVLQHDVRGPSAHEKKPTEPQCCVVCLTCKCEYCFREFVNVV